jgi:hypothetical protein
MPNPVIEKRKSPFLLIGLVALMNVILIGACLLFMSTTTLQAQDDKGEATPTQPDVVFDVYPHPFSRGALAYSLADRWNTTDLTYYFHNCPRTIDCDDGYEAVRAGFQAWADLSTLTFTEVSSARQADIELTWTSNAPELGRIGGVLAFAYFPSDGGDIFFDDSEPWSVFDGGEFDLFLVAAHEIGHALGLNHSSDPNALMYPVLTRRTYGLSPDDAAAIQALYGENSGVQDTPQSFPDDTGSEESSGQINDRSPYEVWEFDAFAGETVTVTMTTTSGDLAPYVAILTGDEEIVLVEGGSDDGISAQVSYTLDQDSTYVIIATREGVDEGFTVGTYDLRLDFSEGTAAVPTAPSGDDMNIVLATVRSYSLNDLCEVYLSPSSETEWGSSLIDRPLTYGNYIDLEVTPGLYDVLAVGCDGTEVEQYEVSIDQDLEIEIYEDGINIYVYSQ